MSFPKAAASAVMYCSIACFSTMRSQILPLPLSAWTHTSLPSATIVPTTHQVGTLPTTVPPAFLIAFS